MNTKDNYHLNNKGNSCFEVSNGSRKLYYFDDKIFIASDEEIRKETFDYASKKIKKSKKSKKTLVQILSQEIIKGWKGFISEPWKVEILIFFLFLGIIVALFKVWNWCESSIAFLTLGAAVVVWIQTKKTSHSSYREGEGKLVIVLQVNRPVVSAIKKIYGNPYNPESPYQLEVIDVKSILGKENIESDNDYINMAQRTYSIIKQNQDKEIHLYLSGPGGLALLIGQMVGSFFDLTIYQHIHSGKYRPLPRPTREWLNLEME